MEPKSGRWEDSYYLAMFIFVAIIIVVGVLFQLGVLATIALCLWG